MASEIISHVQPSMYRRRSSSRRARISHRVDPRFQIRPQAAGFPPPVRQRQGDPLHGGGRFLQGPPACAALLHPGRGLHGAFRPGFPSQDFPLQPLRLRLRLPVASQNRFLFLVVHAPLLPLLRLFSSLLCAGTSATRSTPFSRAARSVS